MAEGGSWRVPGVWGAYGREEMEAIEKSEVQYQSEKRSE